MSVLYETLVEFVNGETTANRVSFFDSENIIRITRVNDNNRGKSLVYLNFSYEEYIKLFITEEGEYNNNYLINVAFDRSGYYGGNVFIDSYSTDNDWDEGYGFQQFNDENLVKVENILRLLRPELSDTDLRNHGIDSQNIVEISNFLRQEFSNEVDQMIYDYTDYYDNALVEGMRWYVKDKLCNKLMNFGIFEKKCATVYMTTVSNIITLWDKSGVDKEGYLTDVLKSLIKENDLEFDEDLFEDYYAYYDSKNFDYEGYNREVGRELDRILNKIEEGDNFEKYKKNADLYEKLSKLKYDKFNKWYEFPKQKSFGKESDARFNIVGVQDGKIHVLRRATYGHTTNEFMDYETFMNFLYHPELF